MASSKHNANEENQNLRSSNSKWRVTACDNEPGDREFPSIIEMIVDHGV